MPAIDPTGPFAALGVALTMLAAFVTGKILARNTVPREDLAAVLAINATLAAAVPPMTEAVKVQTATIPPLVAKVDVLTAEVRAERQARVRAERAARRAGGVDIRRPERGPT